MMNFFKKRKDDILTCTSCDAFLIWLFNHHYKEIAPLLIEWKESLDA